MQDAADIKEGQASEPAKRTSSRLLAAALVFDAVLVVAFGGAVAAKLYQHWKAPAAPPAAVRQARKPAKVEAPAPEPAKPPEPPKQAEAPKPEPPKPEPAKDAPRPPKPSLLAESPKPRETPKPQAKAPEPPKPALAPAPVISAPAGKAVPVEFKVKAPAAKHVFLNGAFIVRGGRKEMVRQADGLWTLTLYLTPNTYRYAFIIDGKRMKDPENPSSSLTVQPQ